jgi:hypothetical protein
MPHCRWAYATLAKAEGFANCARPLFSPTIQRLKRYKLNAFFETDGQNRSIDMYLNG